MRAMGVVSASGKDEPRGAPGLGTAATRIRLWIARGAANGKVAPGGRDMRVAKKRDGKAAEASGRGDASPRPPLIGDIFQGMQRRAGNWRHCAQDRLAGLTPRRHCDKKRG